MELRSNTLIQPPKENINPSERSIETKSTEGETKVGVKRKRFSDYNSMTKKELKALCRSEGLLVGGNKTALITRLMNPTQAKKRKTNGKRRGTIRTTTVDKKLKELGLKPSNVSNCVKKAIQRRFIELDVDNPMDQIVCKGECWCGHSIDAKLSDVLTQSDYGGDYEEGGEGASLKCPKCENGIYVTDLCSGRPSFDSGKGHNHCTECMGFGQCCGDYRNRHCKKCGKHYFSGLSGFSCPCKERRRGFGFGGGRRRRGFGGGAQCNLQ